MTSHRDVLHLWVLVAGLKPENSLDVKAELLRIEHKKNPIKCAQFRAAVMIIITLHEF